jgi:hypothetical protein
MTATVLVHKNMDQELASLERPPEFVNNMSLETEDDRQFLKGLMLNYYDSPDVMSSTPRCHCGTTRGQHMLNRYCGHCGHPVKKPNGQKIESTLWIAAPKPIGLLPTNLLWIYVQDVLKGNHWDGLAWICDPYYADPDTRNGKKPADIVRRYYSLGITRGLKTFIECFDLILEKVILPSVQERHRRTDLYQFCKTYRHQLFAQATPIPNKIAMVIEENGQGKFYDDTIDSAIEAAFTAAETFGEENIRKLESRFTKVLCAMATFCRNAVKDILLRKKGFLRRACYGLRLKFAFRSVVTSQHGPHDYRGVGVPYRDMVTVFEPFLRKRLIEQHGMTFRQSMEYIQTHQKDCDPLLWRILEEFIAETPPDLHPNPAVKGLKPKFRYYQGEYGRGIGCFGVRFPSLDRGSNQQLFIQYITEDTIEVSVLILRAWNCDFDVQKSLQEVIWMTLKPFLTSIDMLSPRMV